MHGQVVSETLIKNVAGTWDHWFMDLIYTIYIQMRMLYYVGGNKRAFDLHPRL